MAVRAHAPARPECFAGEDQRGGAITTCVLGVVPFMAELLTKETLCNLPWASQAGGARWGDSRPHPGDTSISLLASPLDSELVRPTSDVPLVPTTV